MSRKQFVLLGVSLAGFSFAPAMAREIINISNKPVDPVTARSVVRNLSFNARIRDWLGENGVKEVPCIQLLESERGRFRVQLSHPVKKREKAPRHPLRQSLS